MKYLVYLLLLANLGVFAWLYTHQNDYRPTAPVAAAFPPSVEPLVLLRERGDAEAASAPIPSEPEPRAATPPVSAALPAPAQESSTSATEMPAQESAQASADVETPPLPDASALHAEAAPEAAPVAPPPMARVCQSIGPFFARKPVEEFMSRLTALGQTPVMRTAQIEQPSGYWVFLPAMPRAEARRTVDELAAKGVRDYFLGREGYISLGIFSDKRTAEIRVRDINQLGYQPRLEPHLVTREVYWADFEERGPDHISAEQWHDLLGAQHELRRQPLACE